MLGYPREEIVATLVSNGSMTEHEAQDAVTQGEMELRA